MTFLLDHIGQQVHRASEIAVEITRVAALSLAVAVVATSVLVVGAVMVASAWEMV